MNLYKSHDNRTEIGIVNHGKTIRIALSGYALHIDRIKLNRFVLNLLEFSAVLIVTYALFRIGTVCAFYERGYVAYGGEYLILLLPVIYYSIPIKRRLIHD